MARYMAGLGTDRAGAAGVVLAGPGIRDNAARALWIVLGLAAILACYVLARPKAAGAA